MEGAESATTMSAGPNIISIFQHKLKYEWKSKASCGRHYYRTNDILKWMRSSSPNKRISNTDRLLIEAHEAYEPTLKIPNSDEVDNQDSCCLNVFAVLLELNYGHLILLFQRYRITDKSFHDLPNKESLEQDLLRKALISDAKDFWERFQEKMWLYPCPLGLHMTSAFLDPGRGRWVMPFCKRQPISMKGGTASVYEVAVEESLVPLSLQAKISSSAYDDNDHGRCYTLALKSFSQENSDIFEWEKQAYLAVLDKPGMVQFLGEYEIDEWIEDGTVGRTYNILLEYGDEDLEEFLASKETYPPSFPTETIQFWESLANVATALHSIHNLVLRRQDGSQHLFSGWHCDLKPDNILRVDGEFKLADFGFAKFKPKYPLGAPPEKLISFITGGTETYGAPECDVARRDPRKSVSQTIDTWSFGCVLSVSATWVVLGYQGVRAYHEQRRSAITRLRERKQRGENVTVPAADDAFHDGTDVLPEVREWHETLRGVLRISDTITGRILKIVDEYMLVSELARRSITISVHEVLQRELRHARKEYDRLLSKGIVQPVTESVKEAWLNVENQEHSPMNSRAVEAAAADTTRSRSLSNHSCFAHAPRHQYKSSRINKPIRMDQLPPGRVAHRQDALQPQTSQAFMIESEPAGAHVASKTNTPRPHQATHSAHSDRSFRTVQAPQISTQKEPVVRGSSALSSVYRGSANPGYETPRARPEDTARLEYPPTRPEYPPARREYSMPIRTESERAAVAPIPLSIEIPKTHTLPSAPFIISPSWPIAQEHEVQMCKEKGVRALFGLRKKEDEYLKQFLVDRDIMFLVDNDTSMNPYWDAMTMVLETLVSKVDHLDEDGLDIEFTVGSAHNTHAVSGSKVLSKFRAARQEASSRPFDIGTDMAKVLTHIFDAYLRGPRRATTLIVLTDGVWRGTLDDRSVEEAVAEFLRQSIFKRRLEKRWFTIQFISFGHGVPEILKHLDDEIEKTYSIPDVIDTEHVDGDVYKMILGSFVDMFDAIDPSPISPPTPIGHSPTAPSTTDPPASAYCQHNVVARHNSPRFSLKNIFA
ncbi:hypothetical protein GGR53DRAFT_62938 [Hypoxylon sp. FL1150]|nr:hypothetical protein GGR53DRAFT_62938 [Hypoxylon sp. FL1150]